MPATHTRSCAPRSTSVLSGALVATFIALSTGTPAHAQMSLSQSPLFLTQGQAPLVLLTMARDHKLYYEAYNDYSDLDGDGNLDVGYKPDAIDYYGYFDSFKCYTYNSTAARFQPAGATLTQTVDGQSVRTKKCSNQWSGDFLNYVTTSRMDALRKVLYGGMRSTDTASLTVLERSFIPQDAHAWGKEYHSVARDGYNITEYTPLALPSTGRYHVLANVTLTSDTSPPLMRVLTNTTYRVWEWLSIERPVAGSQCATGNNVRASCTAASGAQLNDYTVRVEVCSTVGGTEANCKSYGSSSKPVGLLQRQGENGGMYFGLLTGSYVNNTRGGVLRKAISAINNEITADGRFGATTDTCLSGTSCVNGIISTINRLKITGFNYSNHSYTCGWIATRQMNNGECEMWGNPLGEMLYEGIRYLSGKTSPTSQFTYSGTTTDSTLGLPQLTSWTNPYAVSGTANPNGSPATFPVCSKPYALLISDVYPSFDAQYIPGSPFSTFAGDLVGLNFSTIGTTMWREEMGTGARDIFVGQSGNTSDGTPTPKSASSFATIRGLAPGEPTRQGSYSTAAVAYYGRTNDLNPASGMQRLSTYSIALAAPLPKLEIPVGSSKVTILPFAKSVGGMSISATQGAFQPTNQIVDFYVDTIRNVPGSPSDSTVNGGRPYYKFRINYEDVEQGADHDMDAVAMYEIKLTADNKVIVAVSSDYAAGSIIQHMGFAISGTTRDGAYLVVRDSDTAANQDPVYFLDCRSNTTNPADCGSVTTGALPLYKELHFSPSATASATLLKDPLWYAAKWGGFVDDNGNSIPDSTEWDADGDGTPDNYFLVTNPLRLEEQLTKAFDKIKQDSATAAATSTNSFALQTDSALYQARFSSDGWGGELNAYPIRSDGTLGEPLWQAHYRLASANPSTRVMLTYDPDATNKAIPFRWASMSSAAGAYLRSSLNRNYSNTVDNLGSSRVNYLRGESVSGMRTRPNIKGTNTVNRLGDIVSSQPQYVGAPSFGYPGNYKGFRTDRAQRLPMIYVGSNDGMLHGFSAVDGNEKLAYVPSEMYRTRGGQPRLSKLTASDYGQLANPHNYYVDGSPTVADVCTAACADKDQWRTIVVGGLNGGGQGIYALNVTNPATFSEANAGSIVMWEFTDRNDADLGYTYGQPSVVRICTNRVSSSTAAIKPCTAGKWVVVFGNGYNNSEADGHASATGHASLFIVDALTGTLIRKISTQAGSPADPNGLATPTAIDVDNDLYADYVYAGDLRGNMWKFDLTSDEPAQWKVAFNEGATPVPLYTARNGASVQKITTAPDVMLHPNGGLMVLFGTGSYIATSDKTDTSLNTVYGIRDIGAAVPSTDRSNLQQQTIHASTAMAGGVEYRNVSNNAVASGKKGWYIDLPDLGERINYDPALIGKVLLFTTTVPSSDVCAFGGWSWDHYVDAITGGRLEYSIFASLGTLTFGSGDGSVFSYASGRKSRVGITPRGTVIAQGKGRAQTILCGSTGDCENYQIADPNNIAGRLSWREIIRD